MAADPPASRDARSPSDRASGLDPALLDRGYQRCAEIARAQGPTYVLGARLLPKNLRHHFMALYAFALLGDGWEQLASTPPVEGRAERLAAFEAVFWPALENRRTSDPVLAAVIHTIYEAKVDPACFGRFFAALRSDFGRPHYDTWEELRAYLEGSSSVVGEMMLPLLHPEPEALGPARAMGAGFHFTTILRDIAADLDRGKIYLPREDLQRFGADPTSRRVTDEWRALMRFQVARARRLFREADEAIPFLPGQVRKAVVATRLLTAKALDLIEQHDYDVFRGRIPVPTSAKVAATTKAVTTGNPALLLQADSVGRSRPRWTTDDICVLLDEHGHSRGPARKSHIHHESTPLHLGVSCIVFDTTGRVLVTTRSRSKPSFPGVRHSSFRGHPLPAAPLAQAVQERGRAELGLNLPYTRLVLPDFRYRAEMHGIVENEYCPVFIGFTAPTECTPDPVEVENLVWMPWADWRAEVLAGAPDIAPWAADAVRALDGFGPDPRRWPAADPSTLPPAARLKAV